jgi:hypothetical protein
MVRWILTATAVLAVAGTATAQQATGTPAPGTTGAPPGSAGAEANAQVGSERRQQLTPQEELAQSELVLARIDQSAGVVRRQLEAARAARDVVKTLCLNDKLSQIDVANRTAGDRQTALQSALQRKDSDLANHQFTILTVLRQRVEQLIAEANQCIGEELAFIGQTQVTTYVDPNLPGEDTTATPQTDLGGFSYPPVCVTCSGM